MPAFLLPDLGEGLTEAEIVTWRVQAGDVVTVDQTVVEVETAKAVVEVPVPFAGRLVADLPDVGGDDGRDDAAERDADGHDLRAHRSRARHLA